MQELVELKTVLRDNVRRAIVFITGMKPSSSLCPVPLREPTVLYFGIDQHAKQLTIFPRNDHAKSFYDAKSRLNQSVALTSLPSSSRSPNTKATSQSSRFFGSKTGGWSCCQTIGRRDRKTLRSQRLRVSIDRASICEGRSCRRILEVQFGRLIVQRRQAGHASITDEEIDAFRETHPSRRWIDHRQFD